MTVLCGAVLVLLLLAFVLASLVTWAATVVSGTTWTADEEGLD